MMTEPATQQPSRYLPCLLTLAIFMQMLDTTILNTALPSIARSLHESPLSMQSAIVAYALTVALLMPLSGYLCDRYGTRKVFANAMLLFVVGSVLCAAAPSLTFLVLGRMIQGMGGAMLSPVPRVVVMRAYPRNQIVSMLNLIVMPALIGPIIGPLLGGYLVEYAHWSWIFLINLPIGILAILATHRVMPDFTGAANPRLDIVGFLLFAGGALGISLAMETVLHPVGKLFSLLTALLGIVSFYGYWHYARGNPDALYAANLFKVRTYRVGLSGNLVSRLGMSSVPFLLPLLLQVVFGYSASAAGWMLMPIAFAAMFGKMVTLPLISYFGYRRLLIINTRLIGILIMSLALPQPHTSPWLLMPLLAGIGLSNSVQFTSMNTISLADLRIYQTGSGNSLLAVDQQLSISMGITLGAAVLTGFRSSQWIGDDLHLAFRLTFIVIGCITFTSSWVFARLHPYDGQNLLPSEKD